MIPHVFGKQSHLQVHVRSPPTNSIAITLPFSAKEGGENVCATLVLGKAYRFVDLQP